MHKTFLNSEEIKLIKGADKIIEKIGGLPSMENGRLTSIKIDILEGTDKDIELLFNINGWINTLDFHYLHTYKNDINYYHKDFSERHIKMLFHNCRSFETEMFDLWGGEIKFGGEKQLKKENRYQDKNPGFDIIIERPYCCFYTGHGEFIITFDESKCEISAELID